MRNDQWIAGAAALAILSGLTGALAMIADAAGADGACLGSARVAAGGL